MKIIICIGNKRHRHNHRGMRIVLVGGPEVSVLGSLAFLDVGLVHEGGEVPLGIL